MRTRRTAIDDGSASLRTHARTVVLVVTAIGSALAGVRFLADEPTLTTPGGWFALDGRRVLDAASRWREGGDPYAIPGYLYSPVATLLAVPGSLLPPPMAIAGWLAVSAAIAVACVAVAARGYALWRVALGIVGVILYPPLLADLALANVTVTLVAGMWLVVRRDSVLHGVPLGIVAAASPKPMVLAFLLWALLWRPRATAGAAVAGLFASVGALALAGPEAYGAFLRQLAGGVGLRFRGNYGLSLISPELALVAGVVVGVSLVIVLLRRGPVTGLVWVTAAGVFLAPYTGIYAGLPLLVALPVLIGVAPWLAAFATAVVLAAGFLYPVVGATVLLVALLIPRALDPPRGQPIRDWYRSLGPVASGRPW